MTARPRVKRAGPLLVAIALLGAWLLVAAAAAAITAVLTRLSLLDALPQAAGRMVATCAVVALLWQRGLLRASGVARLGPPGAWVVAVLAVAYLVPAYLWGYFGAHGFQEAALATPAVWAGELAVQASVGTAEELLFRGLLLVVLVRAWGRTPRGVAAATIATAVLFGLPHALPALAGAGAASVALNLVGTIESGFWWACLVLVFGTVWPGVVIHALTNAAVLVVPVAVTADGQLAAMVLEAPWVIAGAWLMLRSQRAPAGRSGDHLEGMQRDAAVW